MRQPQSTPGDPPDEKSPAVADEPTVLEPSEKPGVLVVDDEHMVRIMVQLGLERNGFDVWLARNGREAIDLYRAHAEQIAVVLLDVCMPGLDGLATLMVLRELNPEVVCMFHGQRIRSLPPGKAASARRRLCHSQAVPTGRPREHPQAAGALRVRRSSPVRQGMPTVNQARSRIAEPPMPTILVVDDDADTCRNMADLFGDLGYAIETADGGHTALDKARQQPYDLGLLDLRMPGMDGLTLCRHLKRLQPPIVTMIVTAYGGQRPGQGSTMRPVPGTSSQAG